MDVTPADVHALLIALYVILGLIVVLSACAIYLSAVAEARGRVAILARAVERTLESRRPR